MKEHEQTCRCVRRRQRAATIAAEHRQLKGAQAEIDRLSRQICEAPVEELEKPYVRGWDRWFEWTPEAQRRRDFAGFSGVLKILQRREWSRFRDFRSWDWKSGKVRAVEHTLQGFHVASLMKACQEDQAWVKYFETRRYRPIWGWDHLVDLRRLGWGGQLAFSLPELLVTRVEPHWVTHRRVKLPEIERRSAELEAWIAWHGSWGKVRYLQGYRQWRDVRGRSRVWWKERANRREVAGEVFAAMEEREIEADPVGRPMTRGTGAARVAPFSFPAQQRLFPAAGSCMLAA